MCGIINITNSSFWWIHDNEWNRFVCEENMRITLTLALQGGLGQGGSPQHLFSSLSDILSLYLSLSLTRELIEEHFDPCLARWPGARGEVPSNISFCWGSLARITSKGAHPASALPSSKRLTSKIEPHNTPELNSAELNFAELCWNRLGWTHQFKNMRYISIFYP